MTTGTENTVTFTLSPGGAPVAAPALRSFDLFPTRIWQAQLPSLRGFLDDWVATVLRMRAADPEPAGRTNRHGWNSRDMAVLEQPVFAPLRTAVRAGCASALREMGMPAARFDLQSWINLHDRGGFNFLHVHEGCLLSGSFYLQVPPGSGPFVFRDPRPGVVHGRVKGAVPNGYSDIRLAPETGLLVLFPCWMEHFVEPHENDEPRIAIAFNAVTANP
ncbi:MAG TPA: TIGR02466 family protein [Rhodanobacteraceae bacterium]|nr:TIGR02466 family protein [Rhodanobacteraceae bacterium]